MRKFILTLSTLVISGCAFTGSPTEDQVRRIQLACAADAGVRPSITALLPAASPDIRAAVLGARAVIDPICANPSAPLEATAVSTFISAVTQMTALYAELKAR